MLNFAGKVIRGSTLRAFYFIATVVVSFVLTPVILRYLGDRMYGFWSLVVVIIGYYGLLDLGLSTAVSRFVSRALGARNDEDLYNIYNTAFMFFSIIGLVVILVTAIIIIFTPFLNLNIASDDMILFKRVILVMGLDVAFSFPVRLFRGVLYSQLHYDIMSGLALLTLVLRTPLIVIVLMAGHGVLAMAIVTVLTKLPEYGLTIFISRKTLPHIRLSLQGWDPETAKMLFSFALYAFIAQLANILRFQIDPVVLASFMSLVMVAHYRIGSLIANHFLNFMIETMSVLQPVFSRLEGANEDQGIMRTLFFSTKISVYVSTFMCFGLIFWGKPFIELWVGPEYLDAYPVLFFLVLGFVFILWQAPSASLLMGTSRHKFLAYLNTVEGVLNLLISIVLVKHYGLIGVAFGTFIPLVVTKLFVQPLYMCRALSISYIKYMLGIIKSLSIVCISLVIPGYLSLRFATPDIGVLLILGAVSFFMFLPVIYCFGLNSSETRILREAVYLRRMG